MEYKYGTFSKEQFSNYKKLLHSKIHWLLIYQETDYPKMKEYFSNLQFYIAGLMELIPSATMIDLTNIIECARLEYENPHFSHKKYRKLILDAHSIVDLIGDVNE